MMFIGAFGDWGGVWEVLPVQITGNIMFDYFFTLVLTFGVLSMMMGWLFNIMTRS